MVDSAIVNHCDIESVELDGLLILHSLLPGIVERFLIRRKFFVIFCVIAPLALRIESNREIISSVRISHN